MSGTNGTTLGASGIGGPAPSASNQSPLVQGMLQRYASMPTEKLTEMAAMMGGTQQGQLIQQLLQQRRTMPQQSQPPQQGQTGAPQASGQPQSPSFALGQQAPPVQQRRGGATPGRAFGGDMGLSPSQATPWWTRREAQDDTSGFLHGATAGRADNIQTTAPGGAYVIPADVVAGLGEGNSLAGARVMQSIISSGPYGTPQVRQGGRDTIPRPPAPYREPQAAGGVTQGASKETPVALSHGEFVVHPDDVQRLGDGDIKRGHRILDHFVVESRKRQIKTLKKLPPPVGSKAK